jgi:hypothetical protein
MVPSQLPDIAVVPSGEKATEVTISSCEGAGTRLYSALEHPVNAALNKQRVSKSVIKLSVRNFMIAPW